MIDIILSCIWIRSCTDFGIWFIRIGVGLTNKLKARMFLWREYTRFLYDMFLLK